VIAERNIQTAAPEECAVSQNRIDNDRSGSIKGAELELGLVAAVEHVCARNLAPAAVFVLVHNRPMLCNVTRAGVDQQIVSIASSLLNPDFHF
jgi:hypothetical protein